MSLVKRLRALDACAISDAIDRLGVPGGFVPGIHPLTLPSRVAGRVVTVELGQARPDVPKRHLGTAAVDASGPDDVIVVAHAGRVDCAGWGGLLSRAARRRDVAGVVVDGAVRDVPEAAEVGLAIYGRQPIPVTARGRVVEVSWGTPVAIAGVRVAAGDLVLADGNGVVFLPAEHAEKVLDVAEEIAASERAMAAAIARGVPVSEVMGQDYERMTSATEP